jgi:excisionase family DNA binding protein
VSASTSSGVTRLALRPGEAAHALSVSRDFFEEHVLPELRVVRRGRLVLIPVSELQRWCERNAARTLEGHGRS